MAIDAFLQFTQSGVASKVMGETQDVIFSKKDPPAFEIQQWSFGASNVSTIGSATGGAGGGKASFEPFKVTKNIDTASSSLFLTCCAGGHYPLLTLWVRKSGQSPKDGGEWYLEWQFKMAFVSNLSWTNADPSPTEEVTFVYGAIQFTYRPQKADGTLIVDQKVDRSWSQVLNDSEFAVEHSG